MRTLPCNIKRGRAVVLVRHVATVAVQGVLEGLIEIAAAASSPPLELPLLIGGAAQSARAVRSVKTGVLKLECFKKLEC